MSEKTKVGKINSDERDVIQRLVSRKQSLQDLILTLTDSEISEGNYIYEKLIKDMEKNQLELKEWWNKTSKQYNWTGETWRVVFDTCEIFQIT